MCMRLYCNHKVLYFVFCYYDAASQGSHSVPSAQPRTRAHMFPPRPGQCAYVIDGAHTEFLVTEYTDHVFVVATQVGKLGTVFYCEPRGEADMDYLLDVDPDARAVAVRMRTLIGKRDDTTLNACARHIGEVLFARGLQKYVDLRRRRRGVRLRARNVCNGFVH